MKERPILFSAPMVRAILDGDKTQTRRVVKQELRQLGDGDWYEFDHRGINYRVNARHTTVGAWANLLQFCPYGQIGDHLWVRESWRIGAWNEDEDTVAIDYLADNFARREWTDVPLDERDVFQRLWIQSTDDAIKAGLETDTDGKYHWEPGQSPCRGRPSIHMPRWASRINLEITNVRVERLQEISEEDAIVEGIERIGGQASCSPWKDYSKEQKYKFFSAPSASYRGLWESINGEGSWLINPWVWVIEFKQIDKIA